MFYLLLAICCGSLFSILFKIYQQKGIDSLLAILFNYITAFGVGFTLNLQNSGGWVNPIHESWVGFALLQGFFFMGGFIVMARSTRLCGVALTTISARVSLIIPVICSYLLLDNQQSPAWIPIVLVLFSFVLMFSKSGIGQSTTGIGSRLFPLIVFLFYGISDFSLKLVQHYISKSYAADAVDQQLTALISTIFFMAMLLCLLLYVVRGHYKQYPLTWKNAGAGVLLGLVNLGCTSFTLRALTQMPAVTYYPIYNIGVVLLATFVGLFAFKEKLSRLQLCGILVAVLAILLFFCS